MDNLGGQTEFSEKVGEGTLCICEYKLTLSASWLGLAFFFAYYFPQHVSREKSIWLSLLFDSTAMVPRGFFDSPLYSC